MGKQKELYETITNQILEQLKELRDSDSTESWTPNWALSTGMPMNGHSGHVYSGVNVLCLLIQPFTCSRWYTYNQAKKEGGHVRKGESGIKVCYFNFQEIDKKDWEKTDKEKRKESENDDFQATKTIPFIRVYTVFNEDQIEGVDKSEDVEYVDPIERCEAMVPSEVVIRKGQPSYSFGKDIVRMPEIGQFDDTVSYYKTLFHELGHWTGHESRLDRDMSGRFGDETYAIEELVAELSSLFLSAEVSIEPSMKHSAKYLDHWIDTLEEDPYAIFTVSREAKEATQFVKDESNFEDKKNTEKVA